MNRIVGIKDGNKRPIEIETFATTYGELKIDLKKEKISLKDKRVIVREGKVSLELDEAVLPAGNFLIYLFPQKVKSGSELKEKAEKLADRITKDTAKMKGIIEEMSENGSCDKLLGVQVSEVNAEWDSIKTQLEV